MKTKQFFKIIFFSILLSFQNQKSKTQFIDFQIPFSTLIDSNIILPPAWAFGVLYGGYTNQEQTIERIQEIQEHNYPIDAYWIDSWFWSFVNQGKGPEKYIDFIADTISFSDRQIMWEFMQKQNIKGGFWIWDCILKTGNEEVFHEFETRNYFSKIFLNKNPWHNSGTSTAMFQNNNEHPGTLCGNINFNNPEAVLHFKAKMKHFFDEGADFIKLDRTDNIDVCRTMFEMSQEFGLETKGRGFMLSHSGGTNNEEYKRYPTKWTDDTRTDWTIENSNKDFDFWVPKVAFKENIALYTNPESKTSNIPFLTNDLGGFDIGKDQKTDEELFIRWLQFSMFCPITEVFTQPENTTANLAWKYSLRADTLFRYYSHLRMKLFPYIYSYAHLSRFTGVNLIRKIPGQLYEYMFGNEILVAPVYEKGTKSRTVYLPSGKWIHFQTGKLFEGGQEYNVPAPLEQIPIFIAQGASIPSRNYSSSIESGTNDTLFLDIFPGKDAVFNLIEDDETSNEYLNGNYAITRISSKNTSSKFNLKVHPITGNFEGMSSARLWIFRIHNLIKPVKITYNGYEKAYILNKQDEIINFEIYQDDKANLLEFEIMYITK